MLRITSMGLSIALGLVGCAGDADVAGEYTIAVTNQENGCMFNDWEVGNTMSNIPLTITQNESAITGTIGGPAGVFLGVFLGSSELSGTVDGEDIELTRFGTTSAVEGECSFRLNLAAVAEIDGDFLAGDLLYTYDTNPSPDCGFRSTCVTRQSFNGTRPPR
jgi:hypothetical protein